MGGVVKDINDNNEHGTFIQITKGLFEEGMEGGSELVVCLIIYFSILYEIYFSI